MKTKNQNNSHTSVYPLRVIISGGGTGGHLFPALAIAEKIKESEPASSVMFVGAKGKMEMEKVPRAGFEIRGLWISGLQRGRWLKNFTLPLKITTSLVIAYKIIKKFKPGIAVGTGGYASAPLLYVASRTGIPTLIQEQNYYPGLTNRFLAKYVDKICVPGKELESYFPREKMVVTGNPVRNDLLKSNPSRKEACAHFQMKEDLKTILVLGGSLGARSINKAILKGAETLSKNHFQVIWQTGKLYYEWINKYLEPKHAHAFAVQPFIEKMHFAYAAADLVICRAGAITLAELAVQGKPAILVPSPNVAEDHQTKNALALAERNAAKMVKDENVHTSLVPEILNIIKNKSLQEDMSRNIREMAHKDATGKILREIENLTVYKN